MTTQTNYNLDTLQPRGLECVKHLAAGYSTVTGAAQMGITVGTFKNHLFIAKKQIPVTTYRLVALYVRQYGLPEK